MQKIAIYGAGGFGKEVAMLIEQINHQNPKWQIDGFFDDRISKGTVVNGYPVMGGVAEANSINQNTAIAIAIGDSKVRAEVRSNLNNAFLNYPVLVHPSVYKANSVATGEGTIITAGCILTVNINIGRFAIINLNSTIGHDSELGDFASLMPGVNLSGGVIISQGAYIGSGSQVLNGIEIGANATIGAGAVVTKNIPANAIAVGVPARVIKDTE